MSFRYFGSYLAGILANGIGPHSGAYLSPAGSGGKYTYVHVVGQ